MTDQRTVSREAFRAWHIRELRKHIANAQTNPLIEPSERSQGVGGAEVARSRVASLHYPRVHEQRHVHKEQARRSLEQSRVPPVTISERPEAGLVYRRGGR